LRGLSLGTLVLSVSTIQLLWNMTKLFSAFDRLGGACRSTQKMPQTKLTEYIQMLEKACQRDPRSADLRTCLGIAQAKNDDLHNSMRSFEQAIRVDSKHFYARFKYAEMLYRLRNLPRAQEETRKAVELAHGNWQLSMAFRQLEEIGSLLLQSPPDQYRPLKNPALALFVLLTTLSVIMFCR
jgi:tetratricopeptide (TPR) repeat protein